MEIELLIEGGKYPIRVKSEMSSSGKVNYYSEYLGSTISAFPAHKRFKGDSIEESIQLIATDLQKAIRELMEQ